MYINQQRAPNEKIIPANGLYGRDQKLVVIFHGFWVHVENLFPFMLL